jgi:chemotaxis methyl-accepting protein methylase
MKASLFSRRENLKNFDYYIERLLASKLKRTKFIKKLIIPVTISRDITA